MLVSTWKITPYPALILILVFVVTIKDREELKFILYLIYISAKFIVVFEKVGFHKQVFHYLLFIVNIKMIRNYYCQNVLKNLIGICFLLVLVLTLWYLYQIIICDLLKSHQRFPDLGEKWMFETYSTIKANLLIKLHL